METRALLHIENITVRSFIHTVLSERAVSVFNVTSTSDLITHLSEQEFDIVIVYCSDHSVSTNDQMLIQKGVNSNANCYLLMAEDLPVIDSFGPFNQKGVYYFPKQIKPKLFSLIIISLLQDMVGRSDVSDTWFQSLMLK